MRRFFAWVGRVLNTPILSLPGQPPGRRYERELDRRPVLDDPAFYETYYAGSGIPGAVPAGVRRVYAEQLGRRWMAVRPEDGACDFLPDLDFAEIVWDVAEAFGLTVPNDDLQAFDGSFDGLVRYVARRITVAPASPPDHDGGAPVERTGPPSAPDVYSPASHEATDAGHDPDPAGDVHPRGPGRHPRGQAGAADF